MIIGEERRIEWNDFVARSLYGDVLQCWEWGELKARTGWQPLPVAVAEGDQIVATCLLLKRPAPVVGGCLLYAPRGPIVDFNAESAWPHLLAEMREVAVAHRAMALKIDPAIPAERTEVVAALEQAGFRARHQGGDFGGVQPRYVMKVDISGDLDELMASFKPKTRYNIRLAERRGVEVPEECRRHDLPAFYELLKTTAERDGFVVRDISYFYDIWDLIIEPGLGRLFLAQVADELVAGTIAFILGHQAWYVYGASSNRHRNLMPNYLLQWRMMQWAKQQGCTVFDMRGVAREINGEAQGSTAGLNRFKRGFAAQYVEYIGDWDLILRPGAYRLFDWAQPITQRLGKLKSRLRRSRIPAKSNR